MLEYLTFVYSFLFVCMIRQANQEMVTVTYWFTGTPLFPAKLRSFSGFPILLSLKQTQTASSPLNRSIPTVRFFNQMHTHTSLFLQVHFKTVASAGVSPTLPYLSPLFQVSTSYLIQQSTNVLLFAQAQSITKDQ